MLEILSATEGFSEQFDVATKATEFDRFMLMYPGGIPGALGHVKRINKLAAAHARRSGGEWAAITIWDWLGFLSVVFARSRYSSTPLEELFKPSAEFGDYLRGPNFTAAQGKTKFGRIRTWAHAAFSTDNTSDPWNHFRGFVEQYNDHMRDLLQLGRYWIADESMGP